MNSGDWRRLRSKHIESGVGCSLSNAPTCLTTLARLPQSFRMPEAATIERGEMRPGSTGCQTSSRRDQSDAGVSRARRRLSQGITFVLQIVEGVTHRETIG